MHMNVDRIASLFAIGLLLMAMKSFAAPTLERKEKSMTPTEKEQVIQLLKSIETGDVGPVGYINAEKYIQHNLNVGDGLAGFGAVLQQLPKGSAKVNTVRVLQDGDFVVSHTEYDFFGPKIGFDVFRFEHGKIVEHWDNLQETPAQANPSGRTMTDGDRVIKDIEKTASNKKLVANFVDDILVNGKLDKLASYFDGDHYIQHNPAIADGLSGLGAENKKLAEQGVTMETIPAKQDWKNQNGKFGF